MSQEPDELYVGYLPAAPPEIAARVRRAVLLLLALAVLVGAILASSQGAVGPGRFEFGVVRDYEGVLEGGAHPVLRVEQGGVGQRYLLSAFGKHGAEGEVEAFVGQRVRLAGSLIERDGERMIEVEAGSVEALGPGTPVEKAEVRLGAMHLVGEIVDSKCHLGVMKPGDGKAHRACAIRCISGGVPPLLWARDEAGHEVHVLLEGLDGRPIGPALLDRVGVPVEVSGEVVRRGELLAMAVEPGAVRRRGPIR